MKAFCPLWGTVTILALSLGLAASAASANTVWTPYVSADGKELQLVFVDGSGLSGQALLKLSDSRTIEILLTNTSTAVPNDPGFDNPSDQALTALYFDLGAPGLNASDPGILSGQAFVAAGSAVIGGRNPLPEGTELSDQWGFGNYKYTELEMAFLAPNFVCAMRAHTTAFDGTSNLRGPDYGTVSAANLLDVEDLEMPLVSNSVRILLTLDQDLDTLGSIIHPANYAPHVEFGSDYRFIGPNDEPPNAPVVPEPLTAMGLLLGAGGLAGYIRRRR